MRFIDDDTHQACEPLTDIFRRTDMSEARQQAEQQVGIGRIADDQAAKYARRRALRPAADPDFVVDRVAFLELGVGENELRADMADETRGTRLRRQQVIPRAQPHGIGILGLEPAFTFGHQIEGGIGLVGRADAPLTGCRKMPSSSVFGRNRAIISVKGSK